MARSSFLLAVVALGVAAGILAGCDTSADERYPLPATKANTLPACASNPQDCYKPANYDDYVSRTLASMKTGIFKPWFDQGLKIKASYIPTGTGPGVSNGCGGGVLELEDGIGACPVTSQLSVGQAGLAKRYGDGTTDLAAAIAMARWVAALQTWGTDRSDSFGERGVKSLFELAKKRAPCAAGAYATSVMQTRVGAKQAAADKAAVARFLNLSKMSGDQRESFSKGLKNGLSVCGI